VHLRIHKASHVLEFLLLLLGVAGFTALIAFITFCDRV
jgi:hypothetical protein